MISITFPYTFFLRMAVFQQTVCFDIRYAQNNHERDSGACRCLDNDGFQKAAVVVTIGAVYSGAEKLA